MWKSTCWCHLQNQGVYKAVAGCLLFSLSYSCPSTCTETGSRTQRVLFRAWISYLKWQYSTCIEHHSVIVFKWLMVPDRAQMLCEQLFCIVSWIMIIMMVIIYVECKHSYFLNIFYPQLVEKPTDVWSSWTLRVYRSSEKKTPNHHCFKC